METKSPAAKLVERIQAFEAFHPDIVRHGDADIKKQMDAHPGQTRVEAAQAILATKEGWYEQTPEGEYLLSVIKKGK
jgi:hypothetical protein